MDAVDLEKEGELPFMDLALTRTPITLSAPSRDVQDSSLLQAYPAPVPLRLSEATGCARAGGP